jgi:hypothetical protein
VCSSDLQASLVESKARKLSGELVEASAVERSSYRTYRDDRSSSPHHPRA